MRSLMPLADWRGCVTLFSGFFDPLPADELPALTFGELVAVVAGAPALGSDKSRLPYYVPCLLQDAPLTSKMAARTGKAHGKQRSAAHVTHASFLVFDLDGLSDIEFRRLLQALREAEVSFICYSSHSYGRPDKPGIRARLIILIDRPLTPSEYALAWNGFDHNFCGGAIAAKDSSGRNLWQQQGVWATAPDRTALAFREIHKAGVASADALIAIGASMVKPKPERSTLPAVQTPPNEIARRLELALPFMDADTTSIWTTCMTAIKAVAPVISNDCAKALAVRYSEQGSDAAKASNDDDRYNPESFFHNVSPQMPPEAAVGTLLAFARDGAIAAVNADRGKTAFSKRGHAAAVYLARFHRCAFDELVGSK